MTQIKIISMADQRLRRAQFREQAERAGVEWDFVDALRDPPPGLAYDPRWAISHFGRPLAPGEIGCYASHWSVWRALVASGDAQWIVLEDDVVVDWAVMELLAQFQAATLGIDLIRLYSTHPFDYRIAINSFLGPHSHLVEVRGLFMGTQGYLLTRRAARELLRIGSQMARPVDWLMARYWEYDLRNYCLFPFPLWERFAPSHIGERALRQQGGTLDRLTRQAHRVFDRGQRVLHDHWWFRARPFGHTADVGRAFVTPHEQQLLDQPPTGRVPRRPMVRQVK